MSYLIKISTFCVFVVISSLLGFSAFSKTLPTNSKFIKIDDHQLYVNQQGPVSAPKLLLLSGPTDNWHSDSGWMLVLHNYLSQKYHSTLIDRAGQGWSSPIDNPSYRHFAFDLGLYLSQQTEAVIIVAFASSNLSLHALLADSSLHSKVSAILLIDPDVLTEHAINHYTSESDGFAKNLKQLESYIAAGSYDTRIKKKIEAEAKHLKQLIKPQFAHFMDWNYYSQIEQIRSSRAFQINKFKEVADYRADLELAQKKPLPTDIPLLIIDTDFEQSYINNSTDENAISSMLQWKKDGQNTFFTMTRENQCGSYWATESKEHLITVTQPDLIERAIQKLRACESL